MFGLDLSPPSVPRAIDEVWIAAWVDAGRARSIPATRSGVGVQLIVDTRALAMVAEAVCDEAARVLAADGLRDAPAPRHGGQLLELHLSNQASICALTARPGRPPDRPR